MKRDGQGGQKYGRDPDNWYREPPATVHQLADAIDFGDDLIFDPACGGGNVLDVMRSRGHRVIGSDIRDRCPPRDRQHEFRTLDFIGGGRLLMPIYGFSIISNPPYGRGPTAGDMAERFILRALTDYRYRRAAFLLPIEFQCGQGRYSRLFLPHPPSHVASLSERPSMPPGHQIESLGDKAYKGGMAEYCWIVWTAGEVETRHIFLPPTEATARKALNRKRKPL